MKDSLICGMLLGLVAGALLYKHNPQAQDLVDQSEKAVKKELKNIASKQWHYCQNENCNQLSMLMAVFIMLKIKTLYNYIIN